MSIPLPRVQRTSGSPKLPFHFRVDHDDDDKLTVPDSLLFPLSSPPLSPSISPHYSPSDPLQPSRLSRGPILLSSGKPLRSSLKSRSPSPSSILEDEHRSPSFADEKGPGAFMGLPGVRRKSGSPKLPSFHFRVDDDDDDKLTVPDSVLFPLSSPMSPSIVNTPHGPHHSSSDPLQPSRLSRGLSHPNLLFSGKPLKSSLKSRSPSPSSIPEDERSLHLRVHSAPTTPPLSKNVRFLNEDGLESVRLFSFNAKPASLSQGWGDDTETETEMESDEFPFPSSHSPLSFDIDYDSPGATSPIPSLNPPPHANVHFESITFERRHASRLAPSSPQLTGTILWQTTSEVDAHYLLSVPFLPWETAKAQTLGDAMIMRINCISVGYGLLGGIARAKRNGGITIRG
ncbi:hypothetical protein PILCRDRAFT_268909 [Piloderma croceum F 1598]|uniref:Uncharacterized protein n=1 Tax=Piloderma croceum (strain F 1598) TaxID=765440 RepID=A0A0C3BNG8_PILCF|nr:hypothetical protein PILCRDRAFT_268909 [Piloderma croceum F 1598]